MSGANLKSRKKRIRTEVRARRDALPDAERAKAAAEIGARFLGLPEVARARSAMAFWSFGSEVPTEGLIARLHERGVRVALPRIVERELEARTYAPGDPVTTVWFGAAEPSDGEVLAAADIDVIMTPGLAFDRRGRRIGYGGGYYDRFLRRVRPAALRAALCFSVQLLDEPLPAGPGDLSVDVVLTESEIVRTGRASG